LQTKKKIFYKIKDVVWSLSYFLMEMFPKVQHHKKREICLTFSTQRHKKEIIGIKYECSKACTVFINFIFTKLEFCVWHIWLCTRQTLTTWVLEAAISFLLLHLDTFCSTVAFS